MTPKKLFTLRSAAAILGLSRETLKNQSLKKKLRTIKNEFGWLMVTGAEIERYGRENKRRKS